jgi:hypothetical protein
MKSKTNFRHILRTGGALAAMLLMVLTGHGSAVRSSIASQGFNGQISGGYRDVAAPPPLPGTVRIPLGSYYSDSTPDGNILVFISSISPGEFVPGVADNATVTVNTISNVFVRYMQTGETRCASCQFSMAGVLTGFGGVSASITPDGRYVFYTGLIAGATAAQILRHDLQTGVTTSVSLGVGGAQGNLDSRSPAISSDGRYVAFYSLATNLVANYPNNSTQQVFVRDIQANQTFLASHAAGSASTPGNAAADISQPLTISGNGRFTVWTSAASNYAPFTTDTNNVNDVYFFDMQGISGGNIGAASLSSAGNTTGNAVSSTGRIARNSSSFPPSIVFASNATNLNPADTNGLTDIYCYKGESVARLVSIASDGSAANAASSSIAFDITSDGRYVAYTSPASNLVTGMNEASNTTNDVFLRDLQTNTTSYVSLNASGASSSTATGATFSDISDDGRFVSFNTAEPMSVRDNGTTQDSYVRDISSGVSILVTQNRNLTGGQNGSANGAVITAGGKKAYYTASGTNIFLGDATTTDNTKVGLADLGLLAKRSLSDFDADRKNDYAVFRPSEGNWYALLDPVSGAFASMYFGESGNRIAPGDYDGDGKTDLAVFVQGFGRWEILQSSTNELVTKFFGTANDVLTPADFDGDGRTDLAYFRPSNGTWYILQSNSNSLMSIKFGLSGDIPVAGDYDGDNRADLAIFRPATGDWWISRSSGGYYIVHWGMNGDKPAFGDYDGDGKTDLCVFRSGIWYILNSRNNAIRILQFGLSDDRPVAADYDGDGQYDIAVFRPSNSVWYVLRSSDNAFSAVQWGTTGDVPLPAAFLP